MDTYKRSLVRQQRLLWSRLGCLFLLARPCAVSLRHRFGAMLPTGRPARTHERSMVEGRTALVAERHAGMVACSLDLPQSLPSKSSDWACWEGERTSNGVPKPPHLQVTHSCSLAKVMPNRKARRVVGFILLVNASIIQEWCKVPVLSL